MLLFGKITMSILH